MTDIALEFDRNGLIPVVVQDHLTGEVRMLAHATIEAVRATMSSGRATFWSRSRNELWEKGRTSGNTLAVQRVLVDCDDDCVIYAVEPTGATCHTGAPSCFFQTMDGRGAKHQHGTQPQTLMARLESELQARKSSTAAKSYTKSLLEGGAEKIGAKIREEADELARAIADESDERVAEEAADVVYHALVGLASRGVAWRDVLAVLETRARSKLSGHEEKLARLEKGLEGRVGRGTIP